MSNAPNTIYSPETVSGWLDAMLLSVDALIDEQHPPALVGIRRGGVDVGRSLLERLNQHSIRIPDPLGELNIAFYRDDFSRIGLHPVVGPSQVPFDVEDRHIILIDDVLSTGRTVRAAMNEIFDYGRPSKITLAVLVQRTGHELPIRADIVGHTLDLPPEQYVDLDAEHMQVAVGEKT